jgi:hypothetical protein
LCAIARNGKQSFNFDKQVVWGYISYHGYEITDSAGGKMANFLNTIKGNLSIRETPNRFYIVNITII